MSAGPCVLLPDMLGKGVSQAAPLASGGFLAQSLVAPVLQGLIPV